MTLRVVIACVLVILPAATQAQTPEPDSGASDRGQELQPRRVDVEVMYVTLSWLWPMSPDWTVGPEVGGGIWEQETLLPSGDDFTALVHVGVVSSWRSHESPAMDVGLRVGVAELRSRSCSGCLPELFGALTTSLFVGGGTVRGGTRLTLGTVVDDPFLSWSPLVLRIRF